MNDFLAISICIGVLAFGIFCYAWDERLKAKRVQGSLEKTIKQAGLEIFYPDKVFRASSCNLMFDTVNRIFWLREHSTCSERVGFYSFDQIVSYRHITEGNRHRIELSVDDLNRPSWTLNFKTEENTAKNAFAVFEILSQRQVA